MSKLTIVGDVHFKPDNLDKQRHIFAKIKELGNPVVFLGDILHTKEIIRGGCLNALIAMLRDLTLPVYILVGNHDQFNLHTMEHSLESLKLLSNVAVMDKPTVLQYEAYQLGFIPYVHDTVAFRQELATIAGQKPKVVFIHQGINGFDYGNGYIEKNGVDAQEFTGIPLVIAGHFHKFDKRNNILYLGTPFSHDFGESDQKKYIAVLDLEHGDIQMIATRLPEHRTYYIENPSDLAQLDKMKKENHNRIILCGKKEDLAGLDLRKYQAQIIERYTQELSKKLDDFFEQKSPEAAFNFWAKNVKDFPEELIKLGIEILKE